MNVEGNSGTVDIPPEEGGSEGRDNTGGRHQHLSGQRIGRYTLVELLGCGGMGLVFKATDEENHEVALKVMEETPAVDTATLERFRREAEATQKLSSHPSILTVYETGRVGTTHYIAMELIPDAATLEDLLREAPLPEERRLDISIRIAEAISFAHRCGVVHRDIKPSNVLIDGSGNPLLADFGIARLQTAQTLTMSNASLGTPEYMAPEQTLSAKVDARADIYSFGVIFYEMVTGTMPYSFPPDAALGNVFDIIRKQAPVGPRKQNAGVSRPLEAILLKLLEKTPAYRYADMHHVVKDLQALRNRRPVSVRTPTLFERTDRWLRTHKLVFLIAVMLIGSMIALWNVFSERLHQQKEELLYAELKAARSAHELEQTRKDKRVGDSSTPQKLPQRFSKKLNASRQHLTSGEVTAALDLLHELLRTSKKAEAKGYIKTVRLEIARLRLAQGEYTKAAEQYHELLSMVQSTSADQLIRFEQGLSFYLAGKREHAEQIWESLEKRKDLTQPVAYLCRSATGGYSSAEIAANAAEEGRIIGAMGYFFAAQNAENAPRKRRKWRQKAAEKAEDVLPWLVCYLNKHGAGANN